MRMGVDRSVPVAIVIAGVAVAAGLYLGLRSQAQPVQAPMLRPAQGPVPAARLAGAEEVLQQATESLAYQRGRLRGRCFEPALARQPGLTAALRFDVTFDAQGGEVTRGVIEERSTAALTTCITEQMTPLRVPAPGGRVRVEVPLRFP